LFQSQMRTTPLPSREVRRWPLAEKLRAMMSLDWAFRVATSLPVARSCSRMTSSALFASPLAASPPALPNRKSSMKKSLKLLEQLVAMMVPSELRAVAFRTVRPRADLADLAGAGDAKAASMLRISLPEGYSQTRM